MGLLTLEVTANIYVAAVKHRAISWYFISRSAARCASAFENMQTTAFGRVALVATLIYKGNNYVKT